MSSTGSASAPSAGNGAAPLPPGDHRSPALERVVSSLVQLSEDASVPRNIRRGAQSARDELTKARVAEDVRIASAVSVLDDLANDPNIPTHGRTAIWSIISNLESIQ
ncbi:MAG TPA: UPF0147 family protein [Thermoplasmata archaeon]|nr:UPF0147 family protein [Thermoplasmata archaeon]